MAVLAKLVPVYQEATGALDAKVVETGNAAAFCLTAQGASGSLTLEWSSSDLSSGWQPLPYSHTPNGVPAPGPWVFGPGDRIYVGGLVPNIRISGGVNTGALTLWYFGSPFVQDAGDGSGNTTAIIDALFEAVQNTALNLDMEPVSDLNPLPVANVTAGPVAIDSSVPGTTNRVQAGASRTFQSTPPLTVGGAYSTGDYVGPSAIPAYFPNVTVPGGGLVIMSLTITNAVATAMVGMELWLFDRSITVPTDNAAWDATDPNIQNACIGVIPLPASNWYTSASNQVGTFPQIGIEANLPDGNLYYALVIRGSYTWATPSSELTLKLGALLD